MKRVVITGIGMVSPIGLSASQAWNSIEKKEVNFEKSDIDGVNFVGKVSDTIFDQLSTKDKRYMDRCAQLAYIASKEAIEDSNILLDYPNRNEIGLYIGSSIGGVSTITSEVSRSATNGLDKISPLLIPKSIINMVTANLNIAFGISGETLSYSAACASGAFAIGEAFKKIRYGERKIALTGGVDACILPEVLEGFRKLKALSNANNVSEASIPFSKNRSGFVISEGAAVLVIEDFDSAKKRGAKIYCEIIGYGNSSDAKSLLAPDLHGVQRCMESALKDARITQSEVEYINAHGTSTVLNDRTESAAICNIFSEKPFVSSTKSFHGHALGAAGAIEASICALMIHHKKLVPTINVHLNDINSEEISANLLLEEPQAYKGGKILSNSFAFGGHNASLIFGDHK